MSLVLLSLRKNGDYFIAWQAFERNGERVPGA